MEAGVSHPSRVQTGCDVLTSLPVTLEILLRQLLSFMSAFYFALLT